MSTDKTRAHYEAMAAEAAKVDVLAVMEVCAEQLTFDHLPLLAGELAKARAAVAELIYAASEVDNTGYDEKGWPDARRRLHAALARIGSAP